MNDPTVRFYAPPSGEVRTLRIETTGAVVEIIVGLVDAEGRAVTRVDVNPDGEGRGGDAQGRIWDLAEDGRRVVRRADPRYDDAAEAARAAREAAEGGLTHEYWTLVTTGEVDAADREHIARLIMSGEDRGPYEHGYADDEEAGDEEAGE